MKPIPFCVGLAFVVAGVASVLLAGNGLAAVAFGAGAGAVYVLASDYEGRPGRNAPRRRIDPLDSPSPPAGRRRTR